LNQSNLIRVVAAALVLSTLSFAAGVAGDLSLADGPTSGTRVVLRIPPELPEDTQFAGPLPPLISTASAEARPISTPTRFVEVEPLEKPARLQPISAAPKQNPDRAPKGGRSKGA
jgi:hypothetical protein